MSASLDQVNMGQDGVAITEVSRQQGVEQSVTQKQPAAPRMDTVSFPADSDLISIAKTACEEANPDIKVFVGRIVTGDQFIAERTVKNEIASWTEGYCTEMEGAAIAQAAYLNKVPFVIVNTYFRLEERKTSALS